MYKRLVLLLSVACLLCPPAHADENTKHGTIEDLKSGRIPLTTISPIFGELVSFTMPGNFKLVTEVVKGTFYIREAVLREETADRWSQMITVTGAKGLANKPNLQPRMIAENIASRFKSACPTTFSEMDVGAQAITGHDAYAALVSCGSTHNSGYAHSETALLIFIKGAQDYYTIQWAERGAAADAPLNLSLGQWQDRLTMLNPMIIGRR